MFRLLVAEVHYHVCTHTLAHYLGEANNPGAQVPLNHNLMTIPRKESLVNSVDFAIQFWFYAIPANYTPNWVVNVFF